jgi:dTDP-glucose 4,6-dehydratase
MWAVKGSKSIISQDVQRILEDLGERLNVLSGTTFLITGAGGFLCSYFVDTIAALNETVLNQPCRVIAVDNLQTGSSERLAHLHYREDISFIQHNVTLPLSLNHVDWIIHGASIASPTFYRQYPLETIDVNVTGTRQMLELARQGARSLLYLSTSEVYGDPDPAHIPTPESYRGSVSCTGPRACYDESKRLAETLCTTYHRLYDVPVKMVRPFNVYGPGQRLDDRRIIPDLMSYAIRREPIVLYSLGRDTRAFCYISDAIRAMLYVLLSEADGEVFNVGNDENEISMNELAQLSREIAAPPHLEIDYRVSEDTNYLTDNPQRRCPDLTKMRTFFPWQSEVSLTEGLQRTLQSYQELRQPNEKEVSRELESEALG